jgi:phosphatidylglycerophosphatase A
MSATTDRASQLAGKKPRLALLLATGFGLGYLPLAPGTWGSLLGVLLATSQWLVLLAYLVFSEFLVDVGVVVWSRPADAFVFFQCWLGVVIAVVGVWAAGRTAAYLGRKDPQVVVIDEVSGQQLTLLLGGFLPYLKGGSDTIRWSHHPLGYLGLTPVNWKYLLLGFILFRVFDIWKPFPARQAEQLPGGWGIMADDWVAAIYAALGLWLARALGL